MPSPTPTIGSRFTLFDIYPYSVKKAVPLHKHRFFEIILLRGGNALLDYRGKQWRMEPNQVHICPPHTPHALTALSGSFENSSIALYPKLLRQDPPTRPPQGWPERGPEHPLSILKELASRPILDISPPAINRLHDLIEVMREEFRLKLPGYQRQLSIYAQETLILLLREYRGISAHTFSPRARGTHSGSQKLEEPAFHQNPHIAKVVRWMKENTSIRPNLSGYAKILGLKEKYLISLFTQTVGVSPQRYHNKLRLEEAARHLINTTQPIEEIAARFGFPSRSHFSRQFRDYFHTSPGVYRYSQRIHTF